LSNDVDGVGSLDIDGAFLPAPVLDAMLDGFEASGWTRPADLEIQARECEEVE
jgi:hypothetical protein